MQHETTHYVKEGILLAEKENSLPEENGLGKNFKNNTQSKTESTEKYLANDEFGRLKVFASEKFYREKISGEHFIVGDESYKNIFEEKERSIKDPKNSSRYGVEGEFISFPFDRLTLCFSELLFCSTNKHFHFIVEPNVKLVRYGLVCHPVQRIVGDDLKQLEFVFENIRHGRVFLPLSEHVATIKATVPHY